MLVLPIHWWVHYIGPGFWSIYKVTLGFFFLSFFFWAQIERNSMMQGEKNNHLKGNSQTEGTQEMPIKGLAFRVTIELLCVTTRPLMHQTMSKSLRTSL